MKHHSTRFSSDCRALTSAVRTACHPHASSLLFSSVLVIGTALAADPVLYLSNLDGGNGFAIHGEAINNFSGQSLDGVGDISGDGIDDLIIGAPGFSSSTGIAYVVLGNGNGFPADVLAGSLDGSNGFSVVGIRPSHYLGYSVSAAGDINGDQVHDLLIGAPGYTRTSSGRVIIYCPTGAAYAIFGRSDGDFQSTLTVSSLDGSNGFVMRGGSCGGETGRKVSPAGDVNGDGVDDLLISDPMRLPGAYVVFGRSEGNAFPAAMELSALDGSDGFAISTSFSGLLGYAVSDAGDINGDGVDDLLIGEPYAAGTPFFPRGKSYVIFGRSSPDSFPSTLHVSTLDGSNGFSILGVDSDDQSGWAVSGLGDVNGDEADDILIGASEADPHGNSSGESYVLFGRHSPANFPAVVALSDLSRSDGFTINGVAAGDYSGNSVGGAGDLDGDGLGDMLLGAPLANDTGMGYVVFGQPGTFPETLELSALDGLGGYAIQGESPGNWAGVAVNFAGDINNDGFGDLLIGAHWSSYGGRSKSGTSYVVYGARNPLIFRSGFE